MSRQQLNYQVLLEVTNALNSQRDFEGLWQAIARRIHDVVPWARAGLTLYDAETKTFRFYALVTNLDTPLLGMDAVIPAEGSAVGWVHPHKQIHVRPDLKRERVFFEDDYYVQEGLGRMINLPLLVQRRCFGTLNLGSLERGQPDEEDLQFLQQVATQIAYAIDHVRAYEQITRLTEQLRLENDYLAEEVKTSRHFGELIGDSPAFRDVLALVRAVAPTQTSVLLLGETGTGKELLAREIHDASPRRAKPFIRVNCAALPPGLIESELFGHERGAFTGADRRRAGRFELADTGTIFLDEIGEMPLEAQAKLLRVLQDGVVDRVGGSQPVPVNVRTIAATNADLNGAMSRGTFRPELYYRLNVFPILVPPLRKRRQDIPILAEHFLREIGLTLKRPGLRLDTTSVQRLMDYRWPGNVRELRNVIERAVILSHSSQVHIGEDLLPQEQHAAPPSLELQSLERNHIVEVLKQTGWRIYGRQGAAELLGLNPETLRSRLRKLGIHKAKTQSESGR